MTHSFSGGHHQPGRPITGSSLTLELPTADPAEARTAVEELRSVVQAELRSDLADTEEDSHDRFGQLLEGTPGRESPGRGRR